MRSSGDRGGESWGLIRPLFSQREKDRVDCLVGRQGSEAAKGGWGKVGGLGGRARSERGGRGGPKPKGQASAKLETERKEEGTQRKVEIFRPVATVLVGRGSRKEGRVKAFRS